MTAFDRLADCLPTEKPLPKLSIFSVGGASVEVSAGCARRHAGPVTGSGRHDCRARRQVAAASAVYWELPVALSFRKGARLLSGR
jgi:hypothetical protein